MSGRPPAPAATLRVELLKELQQLIDNRDARDRVDRSPLAEAKGKEHWVLHLLVRAQEFEQSHFDTLIGTAYANLLARLQALDDRLAHLEETQTTDDADLRERVDHLATSTNERVDRGIERAAERLGGDLGAKLSQQLDAKWKPIGEGVETFAVGSRQVLKDVADTYRVATQTRLLLTDNARRMTDLGRDILALEESLKLVVQKAVEDGLAPLEARVAALENHVGVTPNGRVNGEKDTADPPAAPP